MCKTQREIKWMDDLFEYSTLSQQSNYTCTRNVLYLFVSRMCQHRSIQSELQTRLVKHVHFVCLPCDQSVDINCFCLTDSVCSRLCLKIVLGIPVTVIEKRGGGVDEGRVRERGVESKGE